MTVTQAHYTDSLDTALGNSGVSFVAIEFTYEYTGSLGSVDVRWLPFLLEDGGGDVYEYDPSLTREYAMSRGLIMAYGDGDGGYGTVHYELSMPGAAVFAVPAGGLGEGLALHAVDVVNPRSGNVARVELTERPGSSNERMAEVAHKEVLSRLASQILRLLESEGVVDPEGYKLPAAYTHEELGTMIGAGRVAVSRALKDLREAGAVQTGRATVHVRDIEILKRIARAEG